MDRTRYEKEAEALIGDRLDALRRLTFDQARELPEASDEQALVAGQKCALTTFRQSLRPDEILVTVQIARLARLGIGFHTERGLVFHRDGTIRDASDEELLSSGG